MGDNGQWAHATRIHGAAAVALGCWGSMHDGGCIDVLKEQFSAFIRNDSDEGMTVMRG